jgi:hypothetical protein
MFKFVLFIAVAFCFSAFAQSYFVLENGVTLTVDYNGYVYDFGHYTPVTRVTVKGGQYLVEDTNVLVTVDERGGLFRKYEMLPKQVIGKGLNYFVGDNGVLYLVDNLGFVNLIQDDPKIKTAKKFGGNYFITDSDEIFTTTLTGQHLAVLVEGLKPSDILIYGGNYFMTNRGTLYTVSNDGRIFDRKQDRVGIIVKKGGNYFVDSMGVIYTIAQDGALKVPALPVSLRVQSMAKLGSNYFLDNAGKLFTVDKEGNVFERWIDYDLKTTKIISL